MDYVKGRLSQNRAVAGDTGALAARYACKKEHSPDEHDTLGVIAKLP
jgi:hypothetical protein